MIMVALVRSWQDLAKILASIPMHLGKRAKIRVTGQALLIENQHLIRLCSNDLSLLVIYLFSAYSYIPDFQIEQNVVKLEFF